MKPNVFFILIDGLRSDKCYGKNKTSVTPNIDSLIKNGTYFSQAISSAPNTIASISSILTSKYPYESVVQDRNIFRLNAKIPTYVQYLKDFGYNTYATTLEVISDMGLNKIFDDDIDTFERSMKLYNGLGENIEKKIKSMKEPWFYYLHLYYLQWITDPTAYDKNESKVLSDEKFGVNRYERILSAMDVWIGKILSLLNLETTLVVITSDHGHELGDYDSSLEEFSRKMQQLKKNEPGSGFKIGHKIATKFPKFLSPMRQKLAQSYTDRINETNKAKMNPEIEKIEKQNISTYKKRIMKNAVVFTAEGYDERLRVPLLFTGYNVPTRNIISEQVRSIDIFPTIAEIIGLIEKKPNIDGRSIYANMKGKVVQELPVYIDSAVNSPLSSTSNVIGIRTSEYKYLRDRNNSKENIHLYNLKDDPLEENNIASSNAKTIEKMEDLLKEIKNDKNFNYKHIDTSSQDKEKEISYNKEETKKIERELRKLGYIR